MRVEKGFSWFTGKDPVQVDSMAMPVTPEPFDKGQVIVNVQTLPLVFGTEQRGKHVFHSI